jgi:hypothetical protein
MRVRTAVYLYFRLVIRAGNNPTLTTRPANVAGQEVRKPRWVCVLFCVNKYCHQEIVLPYLVGAERRGPTGGRLTLQTLANQCIPAMPIA